VSAAGLSDALPHGLPMQMPFRQRAKLRSRDLAEVHSHMENAICQHDLGLDDCESIDFVHHHAELGQLSFNAMYYGQNRGRVRVFAPPMRNRYIFQFSLSGVSRLRQKGQTIDLTPGTLFVVDPRYEHEQQLGVDYRHFNILVPCALVQKVLGRETGMDVETPLEFAMSDLAQDPKTGTIWRFVTGLCADLDQETPLYAHPRVTPAIEESLVRVLLAGLRHNLSDQFQGEAPPPAPFYIRRAEEFIRRNACEDVTLEDIVAAAGVSTRTLHAGFRTYRDTTPMAHLKARRLELAHEALKSARGKGQTVTDIAFSCGLMHLSKFARDYQERFGETPSETRRRGFI
jgi:AraC-like DNA-binding protein